MELNFDQLTLSDLSDDDTFNTTDILNEINPKIVYIK